MSKQDRTYSRTPEDLERKYNLGQTVQGGSGVDEAKLDKVIQELAEYKAVISGKVTEVTNSVGEIADEVDELAEAIENIEVGGGGSSSNIVYLTQDEYDALPDSKNTDGVEYRITDAGVIGSAKNVDYDNSKTWIGSNRVQGAIDEICNNLLAFPNYRSTNVVYPMTTGAQLSYNVTEDGFYAVHISDSGSQATASVSFYIDSVEVMAVLTSAPYAMAVNTFPVKAGSVMALVGRSTSRMKITKL